MTKDDAPMWWFLGFIVGMMAMLIVMATMQGTEIPDGLTQVQKSPSNPSVRYVPVYVEGDAITVDCDHPDVFCDDEGA